MPRLMGVNGASDRGGFFSEAVRQRTVSVLEKWPREGHSSVQDQDLKGSGFEKPRL